MDLAPGERWESSRVEWENTGVLRSWLVYDSELDIGSSAWIKGLGLALVIGFSVGVWAGIGWIIAFIWH